MLAASLSARHSKNVSFIYSVNNYSIMVVCVDCLFSKWNKCMSIIDYLMCIFIYVKNFFHAHDNFYVKFQYTYIFLLVGLFNIYVSQFTVETYCFADGRCLFKQPQSVIYHWNQYDEEISKKV